MLLRARLKTVAMRGVGLSGVVPVDLLTGLVAAYRFDGGLTDSSGNGKTLSLDSGTEVYSTGKLGQALGGSFGQAPLVVRNPNDILPSLNLASGSYTLAGWYYCETSNDSAYSYFDPAGGGIDQFACGIANFGAGLQAYAAVSGATGSSFKSSVLTEANWYHVAFAASGGTGQLYLNAAQVGTDHSLSGAATLDALGEFYVTVNGLFFESTLADMVALYSVALSAAQIAALYNAGAGRDPTA